MDNADGPAQGEPHQRDVTKTLQRFHELAEETQNPMYGWLALNLIFDQASPLEEPIREEVLIPAWVADWLQQVTRNLVALSSGIDPREADVDGPVLSLVDVDPEKLTAPAVRQVDFDKLMDLVPLVLRLRREGWNAFSALHATTQKMQEALIYRALMEKGLSAKNAMKKLHSLFGDREDRTRQKRIAEGRKLIGKNERKFRRQD